MLSQFPSLASKKLYMIHQAETTPELVNAGQLTAELEMAEPTIEQPAIAGQAIEQPAIVAPVAVQLLMAGLVSAEQMLDNPGGLRLN